jgi:hypothetical protein
VPTVLPPNPYAASARPPDANSAANTDSGVGAGIGADSNVSAGAVGTGSVAGAGAGVSADSLTGFDGADADAEFSGYIDYLSIASIEMRDYIASETVCTLLLPLPHLPLP